MVGFGFVCFFLSFCFLLYFYIYVFILCAWRSKDNLLPSVLSSMWVGAWGVKLTLESKDFNSLSHPGSPRLWFQMKEK